MIQHHLAIDDDMVHPFSALYPPRYPRWPDEVGGKEDDNHGYAVGQLKA
jgi:hypothetical protein